ncbi:MAG: NYN domain-containing protein, partial [Acidobacteria bacterium]|nr:NYN domain-containing protein [Acidobacteriota bacterium]
MITDSSRLKLAVFIDFDNIEIGVKSTLNSQFDIGVVLEALKERGEVVSKTAYSDWKRAGEHSRSLTQHAIKMVQRNLTPGGDKNGADINLALDALEMAFTHDHINAFVIVGGDSDFISLVEKLKQYDKKVFVVGGRSFTSAILQRNCHEFIAYENLVASRRQPDRGRQAPQPAQMTSSLPQVFPLVRRALKLLADREVSPQLGLLKSTLLQLDSTFSERSYGASTFRDFAEKLEKGGLVSLKHSGRNLQVELKDGEQAEEAASPGSNGSGARHIEPAESAAPASTPAAPIDPERVADGLRQVRTIFQEGGKPIRWPMYVRNVKQFLRAADGTFDERKYGFAGIVDLLRACQRDGIFRLERDRQGVMRVFPGAALQSALRVAVEEAPSPQMEPTEIEQQAAIDE